MLRILLVGLAFFVLPGTALAAPAWLEPSLPFGDVPALQDQAGAVMAQDGRIVFARITPGGALEVRERPAGGPVGPTIPIAGEAAHLRVLVGADGTAAVLFDEDDERYASLRAPDGTWSVAEPVGPRDADEAIAPDGSLWRVGSAPGASDRLAVYQRSGVTLLPAP